MKTNNAKIKLEIIISDQDSEMLVRLKEILSTHKLPKNKKK